MISELFKYRIAVTGFDGFIGSRFVEALRALNVPFVLLRGDVRSSEIWGEDFDILYHFAARMPGRFKDAPHEALTVNIDGVLNALEACRRKKARMVFASTCGVYRPSARPFSEEDPLEPPTAYTRSKFIGELLCRSYAWDYGVETTVLRLFNIYGEGQDTGYVISYLIKCTMEGCMAEVYHPESSRDFIHISDAIDVLLRVAAIRGPFNIYNVGSGRSHTILEVIQKIEQVSKRSVLYRKVEGGEDPQPAVCADITKTVRDLGWTAKVDLNDGIRDLVDYYLATVK